MSTERILLVDNLLDRMDKLEEQMTDVLSYALTPQDAVPDTGEDNFRLLSGWVVDGRVFRDVGGLIVLDPGAPAITIAAGGRIKSSDYVAGSSGFDINGGTAEFNDVTVRGTIYANAGLIGGWTIATGHLYSGSGAGRAGLRPADYPFYAGAEDPTSAPFRVTPAGALVASNATVAGTLTATAGAIGGWSIGAAALTGGNATLHSTGYLLLGTGNDVVRVDAADATYRLWAGHAAAASAPFRVTKAGALTATSADITGTVDANAGHLGNLDVDGVITVGSIAPYIQIDGVNKRIRTSTYNSGFQGFTIESDGSAEFNNVTVRGELHTAVLVYGEQHATAGTMVVVKSAGKLRADMTTVASPTTFNVDIEDPDSGHVQLFAAGDILRIKDGSRDNWLTVQSASDQTTFWRYVCVLSNGTAGTFRAGAAVADYGQSGAGGILQTADLSNAPYLSIFTHAGSPWSAITERLRLGNLAGWQGAGLSGYGIAIGDYSGNEFAYYTPGTGLVVRGTVRADDGYLATLSVTGTLTLSGSGKLITAASPAARIELSTTELAGYSNATTKQFYWSATDGKAYSAGGGVVHDVNGITIIAPMSTWDSNRAFKFREHPSLGTDIIGGLYMYHDAYTSQMMLDIGNTGCSSLMNIRAMAANGEDGEIFMAAGHSGIAAQLVLHTDQSDSEPFVFVNRKLYVTNENIAYYRDTSLLNTRMTAGITLYQGAADDEILAVKSSDVAHGITDHAETDTYGSLAKSSASYGGLLIRGYTESIGSVVIEGMHATENTAKTTGAIGNIKIVGRTKSGTGAGAMGADSNILVIYNYSSARFIFDAEGSGHSDVEWTTFDEHDDVALLGRLEQTAMAQQFGGWIDQNKAELERLGIAHFDDAPGHAMVNWTRLSMLLTGAIRQIGARLDRCERALIGLGTNPTLLEA